MNTQESVWKVASAVGMVLVIFLAVFTVKQIKSIAYVGKDTPIMNSISVTGKGEIVTIPDVATFSFTVTENAKTVADAQTRATERTDAALKAVRAAGVDDKDIKTTGYNINPHYEYQTSICSPTYCPPSKSILTGYDVSQTIEVKVRDLEKVGAIFGSIGSAGVQNVSSLQFAVDDIEAVRAQARKIAIADAQARAKELSKQLGVRLVKITSYYDQSNEPIFYGRGGGGDMAMSVKSEAALAVPPEIPSGEQKVISNIVISYEIR